MVLSFNIQHMSIQHFDNNKNDYSVMKKKLEKRISKHSLKCTIIEQI